MLLLKKPSHPYFVPLVAHTKVGLLHPFGKLLQGEFPLFYAVWGFAFGRTPVQRIVALIFCIVLVIRNHLQWGQISNPGNICPARFRSRLKSFRWETNGGSTRCARIGSWSSGSGRGRPNDWNVSRKSWRHSRCSWRWRPMPCELLRGEHWQSTITSLGEIICLPR
jgi:hypothetical protein